MSIDDVNAPTGAPPTIGPKETVATEPASIHTIEPEPEVAEPEADPEVSVEAEPATPEPDTSDPKKQPLSWQEKRRIEETNKRRVAEQERDRLKAELDTLRKAGATSPTPVTDPAAPPPAAQITPAEAKAAARAEIEAEAAAREFTEATGRVLAAGIADIPGFEEARQDMVNNFGDQLNARPDFFEAITSLENGHEVFYELAKDPERTERLLSMSPVKLAIEMSKLGNKPAETPAPKPISKAPAPVKPVGGNAQTSTRLDDESAPMDQWARTFLKEVAGRGR